MVSFWHTKSLKKSKCVKIFKFHFFLGEYFKCWCLLRNWKLQKRTVSCTLNLKSKYRASSVQVKFEKTISMSYLNHCLITPWMSMLNAAICTQISIISRVILKLHTQDEALVSCSRVLSTFTSKEHCLFCGRFITDSEKQVKPGIIQGYTVMFQNFLQCTFLKRWPHPKEVIDDT